MTKPPDRRGFNQKMERTTGFEPATLTLATQCATSEEENALKYARKTQWNVS